MVIAETATFEVGRYLVVQRPRPDNPAWPVYIVFLKDKLVGKSFSRPDIGCCDWLNRQKNDEVRYAEPNRAHAYLFKLRGVAVEKRGGAGYAHPPNVSEISRRAALAVGTDT